MDVAQNVLSRLSSQLADLRPTAAPAVGGSAGLSTAGSRGAGTRTGPAVPPRTSPSSSFQSAHLHAPIQFLLQLTYRNIRVCAYRR